MRILAIGDVVGRPGRDALRAHLPSLRRDERIDVVVVNAENAAGGIGTTSENADEIRTLGADVITGGNHTWKHRDLYPRLDREPWLLRPHNYPPGAPGRGVGRYELPDGRRYAVVNLIGRTFMEPVENPFHTADKILDELRDCRVVLVDFHADATSEKRAMGFHLDGRASAMWGTHTHVPTADEEILPGGTAYVTDVGMTGPYASVIGMDIETAKQRFLRNLPAPYKMGHGNAQLRALVIDVDDETGKAREVRRIVRA